MKPKAVWVECPGIKNDGAHAHSMRDFCSACAPYWEEYPICAICGKKIVADSGFCKHCRKFNNIARIGN